MVVNQRGNALVVVIAAFMMTGFFLTSFMSHLKIGGRSHETLVSSGEVDSFTLFLSKVMRDSILCTSVLQNKEFDLSSGNAADQSIPNISVSLPSDPSRVLAAAGLKLADGVSITSVSINNISPHGEFRDTFKADLQILLAKGKGRGSQTVLRTLPLTLQAPATPSTSDAATRRAIVSCSRAPSNTEVAPPPFQVFAGGSYTFTVPPGVTRILVEAWGSGGSGASANRQSDNGSDPCGAGGGGGGGGFGRSFFDVTPGEVFHLDVGQGKAPLPFGNDGVDGEDTTFSRNNGNGGILLKASGGKKGRLAILDATGKIVTPGTGGAGGVSNGLEEIAGGSGGNGSMNPLHSDGAVSGLGGAAGNGQVGAGGSGIGSGGFGGYCFQQNAQALGGWGMGGQVVVSW